MSKTRALSKSNRGGHILWVGWGDVTRKGAIAIKSMLDAGYKVHGIDLTDDPSGIKVVDPSRLYIRDNKRHHNDILKIGMKDGFEAMYVANPGDHHLSSALEFQHFAKHIIISKPLDTHISFLSTIFGSRVSTRRNYAHFLPKVWVHDHYLNKPAIDFLITLMGTLHAQHDFVDSIKCFLVEKATIEESEKHRIQGLECGMLFDLAVHMISILELLIPEGLRWQDGTGLYERIRRDFRVSACTTAKYAGSILGKSMVMHDREAETFGVIEITITEEILHHGVGRKVDKEIPVLIVVGKGVPSEQGATRDLKSIVINFRDGAEIALDLDTSQFRGIDDSTLQAASYDNLDIAQRGINRPLMALTRKEFRLSPGTSPFQPWSAAFRSVNLLFSALCKAPIKPIGYGTKVSCRELTSMLLQKNRDFSHWLLPDNFTNYLIGTKPKDAIP